MAANAFDNKQPLRPHLVRNRHGLAGEIGDLRSDVSEAFGTVAEQITALEGGGGGGDGGSPTGTASGDLGGTYPSPAVVGLQGEAVSSATPTAGDVLTYDGAAWGPAAPSGNARVVAPSPGSLLWVLDEASAPYAQSFPGGPIAPMTPSGGTWGRVAAPLGRGAFCDADSLLWTDDLTIGQFDDFTIHWWRRSNSIGYFRGPAAYAIPGVGFVLALQSNGGYPGINGKCVGAGAGWFVSSIGEARLNQSLVDQQWHHYSLRYEGTGTKTFIVTLDGERVYEGSPQAGVLDYAAGSPGKWYTPSRVGVHRLTVEPVILTDDALHEIAMKGHNWWP